MHRGGFLSPDRKVFVPKHIWVQKGAKFTAMQAKSECAESLVNEFRQVPPPQRAPRVQAAAGARAHPAYSGAVRVSPPPMAALARSSPHRAPQPTPVANATADMCSGHAAATARRA